MFRKAAVITVLILFSILVKNIPVFAGSMTDAVKTNYLALKESILSDTGKDNADVFDTDIEKVKQEMGIGFNFGNSLDWAFKNNKTRRYKIRFSVGFDGAEYFYHECYFNMTGNLFTPESRPFLQVPYAEFLMMPNKDVTLRPSDPINRFSISISNDFPEASLTSVTVNVKYLKLLDNKRTDLIDNDSLLKAYETPVCPYEVSILNIPLKTTVGNLFGIGSGALLQTDIQLDHFISDYKNSPKQVYKDSYNGEPATDEQLKFLKEQGFRTVRLPVTWYAHMDSTGTVDPEWFEEVNEVVDRILSYDFYVIINIHHDAGMKGWIKADPELFEQYEYLYRYLVLQIAENFKDYGEKLILAGPNEVTNNMQSLLVGKNTIKTLNQINQVFVDEVRSTGYGNSNRLLMVGTWYALTENLEYYEIPSDTAENKIFTEIHDYLFEDETVLRSLAVLEETDREQLEKYNLVMGEFGISRTENLEKRLDFMRKHVSALYQLGIPMIVWDDGGNFILMDRKNAEWDQNYQSDRVAEAMLSAFFGE